MNDGVALVDVTTELTVLAAMTLFFLSLSAVLFKWNR
jgi:hypothetical protein